MALATWRVRVLTRRSRTKAPNPRVVGLNLSPWGLAIPSHSTLAFYRSRTGDIPKGIKPDETEKRREFALKIRFVTLTTSPVSAPI